MYKAITKIVTAIISFVSYGIIVPIMWKWFMVPFGVKPITFFHALGLSSIIYLLTIKNSDINSAIRHKEDNDENSLLASAVWILMLWMLFGASAIYHMFM